MEFIIYVLLIVLILLVDRRVVKLKKVTDEDRNMLCLLLKDSMKAKMVEMKKALEEINKKDVKKTRTNSKTK